LIHAEASNPATIMATYTPDQLSQYFQHIALPQEWRSSPPSLALLNELVKRQLATVPFESLALHYSKDHLIVLNPAHIFREMVERNMGGYCMENNTCFGAILRSLGFRVMNAGGRVSLTVSGKDSDAYEGW
jgi:arylamine N-acetyltransferase